MEDPRYHIEENYPGEEAHAAIAGIDMEPASEPKPAGRDSWAHRMLRRAGERLAAHCEAAGESGAIWWF